MDLFKQVESAYGSTMTYAAAATNAGVGVWIGENWFLVLSAVAVLVRIGIDLPKLIEAWGRKSDETKK